MPVEDYYALIGVSPDADRDTIKDAYRSRRAELDETESSRANAAKLNRAWNVLSDGAQRERYDDELGTARADDDVIIPELVSSSANGSGRPKTRAQQRREQTRGGANAKRPVRQPINQETEINGIPLAASRDRVFAFVIDVFIAFLIMFVGANVLTLKLVDSKIPEVVSQVKVLDAQAKDQKKVADTADKTSSKASDAATAAAKGTDTAKIASTSVAAKQAKSSRDAARKKFDQITKESLKLQEKYTPYYRVSMLIGGALLFAVLAIPSALNGRSPGKALRKLRLVNADGSPAGWGGSLRHYGLVIGFVLACGVFLGPLSQIAWMIALFGCSSFTRSPTRQGWHDRIAKTRVVQG